LPEVRESESKARSQAEMLKNAFDEHGLELRVRAANEAEAACEQRLSAAEAEIEELRAQLNKTERFVFMHTTTLIMDKLVENMYFIFFPFNSMFVVFYLGAKFLVMRSER
jgi:E3 ubiquitin-protein ligase BRE1